MHDDQQFHPWGTVSSEFWQREQDLAPVPAARETAPLPPPPPPVAPPRPATPPLPAAAPVRAELPLPPPVRPDPAGYQARITALTAAYGTVRDQADLQRLAADAQRLDDDLTAALGDRDLLTIHVREQRGWIAHLAGQDSAAVRWYLHATGLLATAVGIGDSRTRASADRTFAAWSSLRDPAQITATGAQILPMLTAVHGPGAPSVRAVQQRLPR